MRQAWSIRPRGRAPRPGGPGCRRSRRPTIGCPIAFRCTRIWCVRPVRGEQRSSVWRGSRRSTSQSVSGLAPALLPHGHLLAVAQVAAERQLDRGPCRRPGGRARTPGRSSRRCARRTPRRGDAGPGPYLATTITPDVSLSSRCTMPGRSDPEELREASSVVDEGVRQRAVGLAAAGVDGEARRLVDRDQVLVLEQDREGDRFGLHRGAPRRRNADEDLFASLDLRAPGQGPARHEHPALVDPARRSRCGCGRAADPPGPDPAASPRLRRQDERPFLVGRVRRHAGRAPSGHAPGCPTLYPSGVPQESPRGQEVASPPSRDPRVATVRARQRRGPRRRRGRAPRPLAELPDAAVDRGSPLRQPRHGQRRARRAARERRRRD